MIKEPIQKLRLTSVDSTHHSQPIIGVMIVMQAEWITAPSVHFNTLKINALYWRVRVVNNNWKKIRVKSLMFLLMISKVLYQLIAIQELKIFRI